VKPRHIFHGFSAQEKRILLITCPAHFLTHFFILVFPAVTMPLVAALGIPLETVVRISFFMYLLYGLCALPVGIIVDRWQARAMLVIGVFLMGAGLLMAGVVPRPHVMAASLALVGVGASVYHPAGLALISRTVRQRGHALGVNGVFGNLGIASAPLVTGILTWAMGWRWAFVALGVLGLLTGALLALVRVDERAAPEARRAETGGPERARYFVIVCVALVFAGIAYRGNMILLPAYLELETTFFSDLIAKLAFLKPQGRTTLAATVLSSLVLLTGIFGQLAGGRIADRMDLRRAYLLFHGASLPFILAMAFVSDAALAVCAGLYAFFSLGMQPIENSLIAALTPHRWRSTSYAVKFLLNFGVGASAVYMIGPVKRAFALETVYVFLALATALLVAAVVVLLIASRRLGSVRN
jgi:MFS family permease